MTQTIWRVKVKMVSSFNHISEMTWVLFQPPLVLFVYKKPAVLNYPVFGHWVIELGE